MKSDRLASMEQFIVENQTVSMETLREQFGVSLNTLRRDIAQLIEHGTVKKVYGGVCARRVSALSAFEVRAMERREQKVAIAQRAAAMVRDGDIIFLDSGTTTVHMVPFLAARSNLTVITHNVYALTAALGCENMTVISLPGVLLGKTASLTGVDAVRCLKNYNIRTCFMAATAISAQGVTNSSPLEYEIKTCAMQRSARRVLLIDSAKFGKSALMSYARADDFDAVVTERAVEDEIGRALNKQGKLIVAGQAESLNN